MLTTDRTQFIKLGRETYTRLPYNRNYALSDEQAMLLGAFARSTNFWCSKSRCNGEAEILGELIFTTQDFTSALDVAAKQTS